MAYQLGIIDSLVIAMTLGISAAISIKFRLSGGRTTNDYLMAGKNMSKLPVILSTSVTLVSAISMLGTPAEVYRYGIQNLVSVFSIALGMTLASYIFIPVFFQCGVSTVYEVIFMSSVLYAPVIALSAVTNLSIELSIIVFGAMCSVYCAVGGLKGAMWADVFQSILMTITFIVLVTYGISDVGGIGNVYDIANQGGRLQIFNFELDLTKRYTFWGSIFSGLIFGFGSFGTSQVEVQRLLSLRNVKRAKSTLLISIFPVTALYGLCHLCGLIYYAIYHSCDPVSNQKVTGLTKYDQIVPYYIVTRLNYIPGLSGFCISGIFSGSLSTISSVLNSLAAVTVVDFIQPLFKSSWLNETKAVLLSKVLSLIYGLVCIFFSFAFLNVSSVKQLSSLFYSIIEGPMVAVFTVGVLTQKASGKCVLFGVLVGFSFVSWIGYGSLLSGYVEASLPLSTSTCQAAENISSNFSTTTFNSECFYPENCSLISSSHTPISSETFVLYRISYMWLKVIGFLSTILSTFLAVFLTGWNVDVIPSDSKCLSPITYLWKKKAALEAHKTYSDILEIPMQSYLEEKVNEHGNSDHKKKQQTLL